jgi:hypothetical protein
MDYFQLSNIGPGWWLGLFNCHIAVIGAPGPYMKRKADETENRLPEGLSARHAPPSVFYVRLAQVGTAGGR